MVRHKSEFDSSKTPPVRQSPFTFRKIQSRELYEPLPEGEPTPNTPIRFRVRLYQPGRGDN
jgi:hypothetical protein